MNSRFSNVLSRAIAGDRQSLELILEMYMPLIDRHSRIDCKPDEDLKQYILLRVLTKIPKFKI